LNHYGEEKPLPFIIILLNVTKMYYNLASSMELNIMDLDNILYVSRGYAPITVQLVEAVSSCMATTSIAGGGGGSQEKY
jgi:hypothetical protein